MKALIGFWLICEAITFLVSWINDMGVEFILGVSIFMTMLLVGSALIVGI